ncbi:nitrite reductase (NADH) small subunit [Saccharomonospora amisosensis]|uniref:Nitrite reductase (NADH) small subunit n=1 Tax=Saccharomonospora amisosensis TaxID=1128677 RepID=A0A7X5UTJ8_9PSEU|nr:nitrite reductase small subunit NirD [Saccharomonospora amisosensis]NIJ13925.1 nitrite reductase (NADH) small subunit [Saccharomonospora amisosensis]
MTAMAEQTWVAVCESDSVPPAYGVAALLPGGEQVAVFRTEDDEFYALSNQDPFSGAAVLSRGIVGDSGGVPVVASPIYKQRFGLRDGVCIDDEHVRVRTYPVRVADGVVHVGSP